MNCNGIHINLFIIVYLIFVLLKNSSGQQEISMDTDRSEDKLHVEHNLYNLYNLLKQRLEKIRNEMNIDVSNSDPAHIKNRYDREKNAEKRAIKDFFYKEFKSRVDKLFNDIPRNPNKTFKRKIAALISNNGPSNLNVRNCIYDECKKRLDSLNTALLQYEQQQDNEIIPSLYNEYKKRLDSAYNGILSTDSGIYDCQGERGTPDNTDTQKSIFKAQQSPNDAFLNPTTKTNAISTDERPGKRQRKDNDNYSVTTSDKRANAYKLVSYNESQENDEDNQLNVADINKNSWSTQNNESNPIFQDLSNEAKQTAQTIFDKISNSETFVDERQSTDPEEDTNEPEGNIQEQVQQTPKMEYDNNARPVRYDPQTGPSAYPTVLTKAFETNMASTKPVNLLATVAQKMNTTALDLAHKLTSVTDLDTNAIRNDPQFAAVLQKFLSNNVGVNTNKTPTVKSIASTTSASPPTALTTSNLKLSTVATTNSEPAASSNTTAVKQTIRATVIKPKDRKPKETFKTTTMSSKFGSSSTEEECEEVPDAVAANMTVEGSVGEILEKILTKLERIQQERSNATDKDSHSEGAPCDIIGSWNSFQMGIRFEISVAKNSGRQLGQAEKGNKLLTIEAVDCKPPKRTSKSVLDVDWKFMGSTMKEYGGPLFLYTQQSADNILALFAGYCRTCGGMDTIFGSWTFLYPCKDCQDITTSIENRRDIFRRYRMDVKRKQRFKEILFQKSHYGKSESCKPN